jgi:DNA-3-methyladenine glycosylase I
MLAAYHDHEWGAPIRTAAGHLERMALEIFQCGLSWKIVLVKRPALRRCFLGFNVDRVAGMTGREVDRLCRDASIIRNRRKIEATIYNAGQFQKIALSAGSYGRWLASMPSETPAERRHLFAEFGRTFKFMGPETIKCYLMGFGKISPEHDADCWLAE